MTDDFVYVTSSLVCKLTKSLYGFKQAPGQWFSKLSYTLLNNGFVQFKADYSLFTKTQDTVITFILVYVDDLLLAGRSQCHIDALKAMSYSNFHMKDLGDLRYFLGLEIDRSAAGFFVSQKKYTLDLLKDFPMQNAAPVKLPLDTHIKLTPDKGEPLVDPQPYQKLIGKLIYLTITRHTYLFLYISLHSFYKGILLFICKPL